MILTPEILSVVALALSLSSLVFTVLVFVKVNKFFKEGSGKSFEDTTISMIEKISTLEKFKNELLNYINSVEKRLKRSVQSAHSKRYNPFRGVGEGGLQSHSVAFVSEDGDGVILSTLATRDRISVFSKPVRKFTPTELELTPEEKDTLEEAKVAVMR